MWTHVLRELLLPPTGLLLLLLPLTLLARKKRRLAGVLGGSLFVVALLLSTVPVSYFLTGLSERVSPLRLDAAREYKPDSIVVLGAGVYSQAVEMDGRTVPSQLTLERCAYAAWLSKQLNVPVVVSGGYGETFEETEAFAMKLTLDSWGVVDVFMESESRNTEENARFCKLKLSEQGLHRSLLVTSASHMARAQSMFERNGVEVHPAPTGFRKLGPWEKGLMAVVPSEAQMHHSSRALRALLAELWYSLAK